MDKMNIVPYIPDDKLYDFAVQNAKLLKPTRCGSGRTELYRLERSFAYLERCHRALSRIGAQEHSLSPDCEWLLDNIYLIKRGYKTLKQSFSDCKGLRLCSEGLMLCAMCRTLLQAGNGKIDAARCLEFLRGFQSVTPLKRRELYLFPMALRLEITAAISDCCEDISDRTQSGARAKNLESLFSSLRLLDALDMGKLLEQVDVSAEILSRESCGVFAAMDRETKNAYLRSLEKRAEKEKTGEHILAERILQQAEKEHVHVGELLYKRKTSSGGFYIGALFLLTGFISLLLAFRLGSAGYALLLMLPVYELIKNALDYLLLKIITPCTMPRMDVTRGIPAEGRTLCVVSALFGSVSTARLEELYLLSRNANGKILFGLLADLPASKLPETEEDRQILERAEREVAALNRKYGGGFYLFTRPRSFDGEAYTGTERKRGALIELCKLLRADKSEISVFGDERGLGKINYIITLDADTRIYPGALEQLIGAAMHPMNRAVIDRARGVVTGGYGIIHPHIDTELESANRTDFALIFAPCGGVNSYGSGSGELFMDAFDCGGFAGKGLIDIDALLACTADFPKGRILSHDALEGARLRGGYMSGAEFCDAFPSKPLSWFKRQHRWIRGDWQNLPWIFDSRLRDMDRFRLFDSLRRSLTAPMTLTAILAGFFIPDRGLAVSALAALLALLGTLFLSLADSARHRPGKLRRHTRLLGGTGGVILQSFMRLWLLPYEAFISLSAILTALYRMCISHRRLLQWQTFSELPDNAGLSDYIRAMWLSVMLGVVLMGFCDAVIGKSAGLMWLLCPLAASALALPSVREEIISEADRAFLRESLLDAWAYLRENSTREDNYLPTDNFQFLPPVGAAHRSSPTNIGFALASAAALSQAGLIEKSEARGYIGRALTTIERLKKFRGHLYNWYDTRTLRVMKPEFISTVDSGNFYAGLLCAGNILRAHGEEALCGRIDKILDGMDFSFLFDPERELFYICYDAPDDRGAGGWYDLMASEAMLTSYLAAAKGDVPVRHWRRLSRSQLSKDGYMGLASWTGTMFEYLMPLIFLPVYRGSLLSETARFCLYVQTRRHTSSKLWGISESAFYSLDPSMNYRYKAHGCPALALKRGQENDLVISPYSAFLALAVSKGAALRNLRSLKNSGAYGRFGFIEALDFTPERCHSIGGEAVGCYMAHHVGMSILSGLNALNEDIVRRAFMSDARMAAYDLLLQEKLPAGTEVLRRDEQMSERRMQRSRLPEWEQKGVPGDEPCAALLTNGVYELRMSSAGCSAAYLREDCIYRAEPSRGGMEISIDGEKILPDSNAHSWHFTGRSGSVAGRIKGMSWLLRAQAAETELGELRLIELRPDENRRVRVGFSIPLLMCRERDYLGHSAYWKLGLEVQEREGKILVRRIAKNGAEEMWLCAACSERITTDFPADARALMDAGLEFTAEIPACVGKTSVMRLAIAAGRTEREALSAADRIMLLESAGSSLPNACAARLRMDEADLNYAMRLCLPLWRGVSKGYVSAQRLWRYGISGDYPIICCELASSHAMKILKSFCFLRLCGMEAELAFISAETGEYTRPNEAAIKEYLQSVGLEALDNSRGGLFFVDSEGAEILKQSACIVEGEEQETPKELLLTAADRSPSKLPDYFRTQEGFGFATEGGLPPRVWQNVLSNGSLGAIAADFGPAALWYRNAREMPLVTASDGVSRFEEIRIGKNVSIFADSDGRDCEMCFFHGGAGWKKRVGAAHIETNLYLLRGINARLIVIDGAQGERLEWRLILPQNAVCEKSEGALEIRYADPLYPDCALRLMSTEKMTVETDFRPPAVSISLSCSERTVLIAGTDSA